MLQLGQVMQGRKSKYTITKQLYGDVWLAVNEKQENTVVKSANHPQLFNERDILLRFQDRTPLLRPLIDEIQQQDPAPAIVLRYLDDDMLHASNAQRLTRLEVKYVARQVLKALAFLHGEGFVHTDIKPSNILVNHTSGDLRFSEVQLADFESTVHVDSSHARNGDPIGTPIFRSPEAHLRMRWGTATDIWSFGTMLISLIYGEGFQIFRPDVPVYHEEYEFRILMKHHRCFGPFPVSYEEIADDERLSVLIWIMENSPTETLKPFHMTTSWEICDEDKEFVMKIMKLDPRDRPSARDLLADKWFAD